MTVAFIEQKTPDFRRIEALLSKSGHINKWANRGPVYTDLASALASHADPKGRVRFVPLANGGVALEAMARLCSMRAGKRLKWVASAFSFRNIGRGYFHDTKLLDCDRQGLLDLDACASLDPESFDGLIVTNPFGLYGEFEKFAEFARLNNKPMLIDNASGFHSNVPDWPWQAFSFHHTKPYGVGEGGAALVPEEDAESLYGLVDYASEHNGSEHWLGNGKISDLSCAFLLDRLERAGDWLPRYLEQRDRMTSMAETAGFRLLSKPQDGLPLTSLPLLAPTSILDKAIHSARHMDMGKYYKPLANQPVVAKLFERLVNMPCHPDLAMLSNAQINEELDQLLETSVIASVC